MATGMVLNVAQTLFAALKSTEVRKLCSIFGIIQYVSTKHMPNAIPEASILRTVDLKTLEIRCEFMGLFEGHETLLDKLFPDNHDFSKIVMTGHRGTELPSRMSSMATSFPGLVNIELSDFGSLKHLPSSLSQLRHLKYLKLHWMRNVEYIEIGAPSLLVTRVFFPSLEKLELLGMCGLKGWWSDLKWVKKEAGRDSTSIEIKEEEEEKRSLVDCNSHIEHILPSFPRLRELNIKNCARMTYFPPCPNVKQLSLIHISSQFTFYTGGSYSSSSPSNMSMLCNLKMLHMDDDILFTSLFRKFVQEVVEIQLSIFWRRETLNLVKEGFLRCASSLQSLLIENSSELKSLSGGGIEHLTNLQSLTIKKFANLDLENEEEEEEEGMPWKSLHFLSSLKLDSLPKLVRGLPKGFQYLTSLQSLFIYSCTKLEALGECVAFLKSLRIDWCINLKALPESIGSLTSLQLLQVDHCAKLKSLPEAMRSLTSLTSLEMRYSCKELKDRCRQPDGEDWPKICHIPILAIR
ncbi:hypothetical protein SOVF_115490 [Spinacia oleracea]|nr:hypothetical protein SOVF_115490 [Spinacia oleracea]